MKKIITLSVVGIFLLGLCFTFSLAIKTPEGSGENQRHHFQWNLVTRFYGTGGRIHFLSQRTQ